MTNFIKSRTLIFLLCVFVFATYLVHIRSCKMCTWAAVEKETFVLDWLNTHSSLKENNKMIDRMKLYSRENLQELGGIHDENVPAFAFPQLLGHKFSFDHVIIPVFVFLVFYGCALFLYFERRKGIWAEMLIMFFLSVALGFLGNETIEANDIWSVVIFATSLQLAPVFYLHFLYNYFRQNHLYLFSFCLVSMLYGLVFILGVGCCIYKWFTPTFSVMYPIIAKGSLVFFTIGMILGLILLIVNSVRYKKTIYEPILNYMIVGNGISFLPFLFLYVIPVSFFGIKYITVSFAAIFLLMLPSIYLYLVCAERLIDINFVLRRLGHYGVVTIFPTILLTGSLTYLENGAISLNVDLYRRFGVIYLFLVLYLYTKESMKERSISYMFPTRKNQFFHTSLDRFMRRLPKVMRMSELEDQLIHEIVRVLKAENVLIFHIDQRINETKVKKKWGKNIPDTIVEELQSISYSSLLVGQMIEGASGFSMIFEKKDKELSGIWVNRKENRVKYNQDEIAWLRVILNYTSIVCENLRLVETVISDLELKSSQNIPSSILRLLFRLSEQERRKLAADLHDSALQDQLIWYRKLEYILSEFHLQVAVREYLTEIKEGLLDVTHQIRETCNELRPPFLKEMGVVEAVESLCNYAQLNSNISVDFTANHVNMDLDSEYVLTIYRITQELLRNTMKHAKATHVQIKLDCIVGKIMYLYQDNGIGMDLAHFQSSFKHMGLSGIRERVMSLEGEAEFHSAVGKGVEVIIMLPLNQFIDG